MPCSTPVFECAGDQEIGESIFVEEEQEDADWGDPELTPSVAPLELRRLLQLTTLILLLPLLGVCASSLLSMCRLHQRRP
jgi:hypothetical protein